MQIFYRHVCMDRQTDRQTDRGCDRSQLARHNLTRRFGNPLLLAVGLGAAWNTSTPTWHSPLSHPTSGCFLKCGMPKTMAVKAKIE